MTRIGLLTLVLLALISPIVSARILNVPDEFPTIQSAIDSCKYRDTILVEQGHYHENLIIDSKIITLLSLFYLSASSDLISRTIIDGDSLGSAITIQNSNSSEINGFTIQNGFAEQGAGIKVLHSSPTIRNNYIINNNATDKGGAIFSDSSNIRVKQNFIDHNTAEYGAGIYCTRYFVYIDSNIISNNHSPSQIGRGTAVYLVDSTPVIRYNQISNNSGSGIVCIRANGDIENNSIYSNYNSQSGGGLYFENCRPIYLLIIFIAILRIFLEEVFIQIHQPPRLLIITSY